jgi:hypothetical protein
MLYADRRLAWLGSRMCGTGNLEHLLVPKVALSNSVCGLIVPCSLMRDADDWGVKLHERAVFRICNSIP